MTRNTKVESFPPVPVFIALTGFLAASLWLGGTWGAVVQVYFFVGLSGRPLAEWTIGLLRWEQPPKRPPMLKERFRQIIEWDFQVGLPGDPTARERMLDKLLEKGIGPRSSMDDVAWLLGAEGADNGAKSPEMYSAVLAALLTGHDEVATILKAGVGPGTKRRIIDAIGAENVRWVHKVLKNEVKGHAYWSSVAVSIKIQASKMRPLGSWVKCEHIDFLKKDRPELWAALSSAGSPSCHVDGVGIMAHYLAEDAADERVNHPYLDPGVMALITMVED